VELGFERMSLKQKTLRCYFVNNPDSPYFTSVTFNALLAHLQLRTNKSHLKQVGKNFMLVTEPIDGMDHLLKILEEMTQTVIEAKTNGEITTP